MADDDAMLKRLPLRFSRRLMGAFSTSPELPVAFYSMIHAFFIVRAMAVYLAPFINRIRFRFHSNLALFWSFSLRSACMGKTRAKLGKDKRQRKGLNDFWRHEEES